MNKKIKIEETDEKKIHAQNKKVRFCNQNGKVSGHRKTNTGTQSTIDLNPGKGDKKSLVGPPV